jgi:hypothetical protein
MMLCVRGCLGGPGGLQHLRQLAPHLTAETRSAILEIKRAWVDRPEYRTAVTSFDIYTAVLDHGVRSVAEFFTELTVPK